MAATQLRRTISHVRSFSCPSASHPLDVSVEDYLSKLQAGHHQTSTSISSNLTGINHLYGGVNHLIQRSLNQLLLSHEVHRDVVEDVLEASLALLDVSGTVSAVIAQMKESILELQSSIRRRGGESGISAFLVSRRKMIKSVSKCIRSLRKLEKSRSDKETGRVSVVNMLRETEAISLSTVKSVLVYMGGSKSRSTRQSWSLMTKMIGSSSREKMDADSSEVARIDEMAFSLAGKNLQADSKSAQNLQKELQNLESVMCEIESGMEMVCRSLVKTRVALLNVLNH